MPLQNQTIKDWLDYIKNELTGIYPETECNSLGHLILEELLSVSKPELFSILNQNPDKPTSRKIKHIVAELKKEKPIQYILGKTQFYDCPITLKSGVLIPRPETEELVHWIINDFKGKEVSILDIGTGSGCIAIALAKNLKGSKVYATDFSDICLQTARINAGLNQTHIQLIKYNLQSGKFIPDIPRMDIFASNPPYILEYEKSEMRNNVLKYEPSDALFVPDNDPLIFYRAILKITRTNLKENGWIYFEINEKMAGRIQELLILNKFSNIVLRKDIHGKDRMIKAQLMR